ncbi:sensor histidine kinase [Streptomyces sp. N35]|uniref:sensor histidine kinase n=1 Tax=Streptomyces sp. N35 TaxID=2795730 RepID=UPI0018F64661|nr:histidine kinase [Streptomyces sp. N35]
MVPIAPFAGLRRSLSPAAWDRLAACGALVVAAAMELPAVWAHGSWAAHPLLRWLGIVLAAGALLWRRTRFPAAGVVVLAGTALSMHYAAVFFLAYAAGRYQPVVRAWVFGLLASALVFVLTATGSGPPLVQDGSVTSVAVIVFMVALTVVAGTTRRQREEDLTQAANAARQRAVDAVNAERSRLVSEFHDLLGHDVALLNILVESLRAELTPAPPGGRTLELLDSAQRQCAQASDHLRSMTGVLRLRELDQGLDRSPVRGGPLLSADAGQAEAEALGGSLESVRASGLEVRLSDDFFEHFRALPPEHRRTARRIVTEALTNVLRHAPGADVRLELAVQPEGWVLGLGNGKPRGAPVRPAARGTGLGLPGLRSRLGARRRFDRGPAAGRRLFGAGRGAVARRRIRCPARESGLAYRPP